MRHGKTITFAVVRSLVATMALALVAFALLTFAPPKAQATPDMAKQTGKPCTGCHTAMPPTKDNATKK
jgi:hypothetical protein